MEESQIKIGLLLEAAESHQATALAAVEALRQHSAGLDAVVREEIRATLIEELRALRQHTQLAAEGLRGLALWANRRWFALCAALMVLACAAPLALTWWLLPRAGEIAALRASREALTTNIETLRGEGAAVELRRCGPARRLCAHIDRSAPRYGAASDYLVLQGY